MFLYRHLKFIFFRLRKASLSELCYRLRQALLPVEIAILRRLKAGPFGELCFSNSKERKINLPLATCLARSACIENTFRELTGKQFNYNLKEDYPHSHAGDEKWPTDIRSLWEPARLQCATAMLAQASKEGAEVSNDLARVATGLVYKWLRDNPFPVGIHYTSAMECALRIVPFCYVVVMNKSLKNGERATLLKSIFQQTWLVEKKLSLFSSRGNHTIAESVGLIFAGILFRDVRQGRKWLKIGLNLLNREIPMQILPDGGPAEQSFGYHRFVLDLCWLANDVLRKNGFENALRCENHLKKGEAFLEAFKVAENQWPTIGDSDDGHALAPGIVPARLSDKHDKKAVCCNFAESGYTVVNSAGLLLTFDHGGLGMPPFFNHGHADALSVTLSLDGMPILVDPGTYRYNNVPEWRQYFKGTRAHNTITIDGADQACQETSFIWSRPYKTKVVDKRCDARNVFLAAEHDGYCRLKSPVVHRRSLFGIENRIFLIKDTFRGEGEHEFELNYHFHPEVSLNRQNGLWTAKRKDRQLFIGIAGGADFDLVTGRMHPMLGWYSAGYGHKEPASALNYCRKGKAREVTFLTLISLEGPPDYKTIWERIDKIGPETENT